MEGRVHGSGPEDWRELYKAALFEEDDARIAQRIAEAERALAARAMELVGAENQGREQQAMENATYFLRLLRKIEVRANVPCEQLEPALASSQQSACSV
jgi:hypothetical protein